MHTLSSRYRAPKKRPSKRTRRAKFMSQKRWAKAKLPPQESASADQEIEEPASAYQEIEEHTCVYQGIDKPASAYQEIEEPESAYLEIEEPASKKRTTSSKLQGQSQSFEEVLESMKATSKKVFSTTKTHALERRKLIEEFRKQLNSHIQQGDMELEKTKHTEEKMQKLIQQQQKHDQQMRISQKQRMETIKFLGAEFFKGMDDLEERHVEQYSLVHNDLRNEMILLQKKILMDTQQHEMQNVRKNLKSMLA